MALVVGLPNLSKATPSGIFEFVLDATLIFPLLIIETDVSNMNGAFDPVGDPKQIGFVPNKDLIAPCGAIAGGALVNTKATIFFFSEEESVNDDCQLEIQQRNLHLYLLLKVID